MVANHQPIRLLAAEKTLIAQLNALGATEASEKLAATGLPTRRVEAYHYTDLKALIKEVPELAGNDIMDGAPKLTVPGAFGLVMANGLVPENPFPPAGLVVSKKRGSPLSERDDVLVSLNRAMVGERLKLQFISALERVIVVDRRMEGNPAHAAGALEVELARGARATVLEVFSGSMAAHLGNHATSVLLGEGAQLTHVSVNLTSRAASHFHTIEYDIGAAARLRTLAINSGSSLSRTRIFALFNGEGAHGDFSGINLVDEGQHCDVSLDVTHAVADTSSTETYKSVARNRSKAVFQGRIVVKRKAQKTDAKMVAQGLMLSEGAQILCKPELEILADDVQCSHGATCGEPDADALFYMMSRGIGRDQAASMLIRAFIQELLDPIADPALYDALSTIVESWLANGEENRRQ